MKKFIAGFIYYGSLTVFVVAVVSITVLGFGGMIESINKSALGWWGFAVGAVLACLVPPILSAIWNWAKRTLGK